MNTSFLKLIVGVVALPLLSLPALAAPDGPLQAPPVAQALRGVRPTEIPANAADLVSHASAETRSAVAREVVLEVASANPSITHIVVGAIARVSPEAAGAAAGTAASVQPQELALIARSAATAAPGEVVGIVSALCQARPENFDVAAVAVAQAVSGQDEKILQALSVAVPSLKFALDRAYAEVSLNDKKVSLNKVVNRAKSYAKWDTGRNEFVDISGIYRNSLAMGSQTSPGASPGTTPQVSSLYGPGTRVLPRPPTISGNFFYTPGPILTVVDTSITPPGPRAYSSP